MTVVSPIRRSVGRLQVLLAMVTVASFVLLSLKTFPPFEALEKIVYGIEMRLDLPRPSGENKIAIVNIDDKSLEQLGPWPWPRYLIAEMIQILKNNGAKLIGLDLLFTQKERNQGVEEVRKLHDSILGLQQTDSGKASYGWILDRLKEIEKRLDNDRKLLETLKEAGNIILPVVGRFGQYDTELVIPFDSYLKDNALRPLQVSRELEPKISVNQLSAPFAELTEVSSGLGHINLSPNEVMTGQVHLPFINYRGNIIPSMPLRMALNYLNRYPQQVVILNDGIKLDEQTIPTTNGQVFIKFKGARRSFPYYSFVDILRVKKVPAVFDNKIVLIGFTAKEGGTAVKTPVDPSMPRVELSANIIEDFIRGKYLKRPHAMIYLEAFLIFSLGLFVSLTMPHLNYMRRAALTGGLIFSLFVASLIVFIAVDTWFKIVYVCLSLIGVFLIFSVHDLVARERTLKLTSKESIETNRMLGLSFQSQGLLDLAFEKFRKCPLDDAMKDVLYNLGLDFERKRMINKAISVYEYAIQQGGSFKDLVERVPKLKKLAGDLSLEGFKAKRETKIVISDDLETKPTVGRYEILGELGQGAMGMVYKARDPKINRLVAIKTIRFADEFHDNRLLEVKDRFFKEAELAGKLSHPSIVAIYDVGEDYDLTYMAMELLDGRDLENFCHKDTLLPQRQGLDIIADVAEALDYAHSQGVIHRDVKPANIMLLKDGGVKVTDFGIAKAVSSSQTRSGVILGTPNYMAPEQIAGHEIDGRSDIFSLGVVFFQLLTGELPFHGKRLTELFYQITQAKHPSPREINAKVLRPCEQLLDKALAKDPNDRFQRAREFAKYLRILAEKMDLARAKGSGGRLKRGMG